MAKAKGAKKSPRPSPKSEEISGDDAIEYINKLTDLVEGYKKVVKEYKQEVNEHKEIAKAAVEALAESNKLCLQLTQGIKDMAVDESPNYIA
jgi:hypothetical protein